MTPKYLPPIFFLRITLVYIIKLKPYLTHTVGIVLVGLILLISPAYSQLNLLKDVDDDIFDAALSGIDSRELTNVNGVLFFSGRSEKGYELWKYDGTTTSLVKDIYPGTNSSNPISLANANGTLYFIADDGLHGPSLYKSDGTSTGTLWIKSLPSIEFPRNDGGMEMPDL